MHRSLGLPEAELNCRGNASPYRDLVSPHRDFSAGGSDEKVVVTWLARISQNRKFWPNIL